MNGVLPVEKPEGPTSHDVVAIARRALRTRRIGHTGTLDPFASGLLLLCMGPATRLAEYLTALPKSYRATLRLGEATDTDDLKGEILQRTEAWRDLTEAEVRSALEQQSGTIEQLPPLYSAKKVEGERMYAAARRGERPERTPVQITVNRIELLAFSSPEVEFEVDCSSGTYIRAIARDVGEALGVGAHLRTLRRTRIGEHTVESALSIESLEEGERVQRAMLTPLQAIRHLHRVTVEEASIGVVRHGGAISAPQELADGAPVALASAAGDLLAIAESRGGSLQPRKVFA
ncbi:MAG TPA: tRNA pseudouridine(55) synthase TruB [Longimicrobiaceae bacterium]|nr:tRNA pseudouridine(55) synthase TruB [Longimicrobiaceae bacterium]